MAAGADRSKVHILRSVRLSGSAVERDLRLDLDTAAIEQHIQQHPQTRLIVIDPISNHLGDVSMVAEQEIRQLLGPLKRIARARDLSVTSVMHLNKKEGLAAINRVGGAGAFVGVARASWLFGRDSTGRVMAPLKNNYAKHSTKGLGYSIDERLVMIKGSNEPIPRIEWLGASSVDANDLLQESKQTARADAEAFLEGFLSGGSQDALKVYVAAAAQGISERTLDRAKAKLRVESRKKGTEGGWEWLLPTEQAQTNDANKGQGEIGTVGTLQSALQ
jgi:AAA domain